LRTAVPARVPRKSASSYDRLVSLLARFFGTRRHPVPVPTPEEVAAVDVEGMIAIARERGDRRSDEEVVAALLLGAEFTASRHRDESLRVRASAAATALTRWLAARVGEDEAARLLSVSEGAVDEAGRYQRPPG